MITFEDARIPTESERQKLSRLLYIAFCDLRALAREGKNEQAWALAEAFHNVPLLMYSSDFSFHAFWDFIARYQEAYEGKSRFDYLQEWEKMNQSTTNDTH